MTIPEVVLFDLGGVLIRLKGVPVMAQLASLDTDEEVWAKWLSCRWVREYERGRCSSEDFAAGLVADWGLTLPPGEFLDQFRAWPDGLLDGAEELVAETRARARVGCLSNMNALHWHEQFARWDLVRMFDWSFLSFELGLIKPDIEVFEHVAETLPVTPDRVLFLDDNLINVEAARSVGFQSAHTRGVGEARAALVDAGVL
jgi:putative hydrolase of the HAD superfamily